MKQNYKTKSVCVVDFGLFVEIAVTLTKYFGKVYYFYPWQASPFPTSERLCVGEGLPGIEPVQFFWDIVDNVDLFVFPDLYLGDLQEKLVRDGKRVFGSRRADELEMYRPESKELFKRLKLPVSKYEVITGINDLRKFLKSNPNQWVKAGQFRGDFETFPAKNYALCESRIDELEFSLGIRKKSMLFVVESDIPAVEIGYDGFCIDGQFPKRSLTGIEIKNKTYIGRFVEYKDLPKEITGFNTTIAPTMKEYNYRNFYSSELRITKDKTPYMIDLCSRCGSPPTEIALNMYNNLPDIMWYGAEGICVDPESDYEWAAESLFYSSWAEKAEQVIKFPPKIRDSVKLKNVTMVDGEYHIVHHHMGTPLIGAVVAGGHTMEEAIGNVEELCKQVEGYSIEHFSHYLNSAQEEIDKLNSFGVKF